MPEFFDISLIGKKTNTSKSEMDVCLYQLGLVEGVNKSNLFGERQIVVSCYEDENSDFEEISIGIPEQRFNKETFTNELKKITNFVNHCFNCNSNLEYALCSYELNGYLIGRTKKIQHFDNDEFLKRFPVVYRRNISLSFPLLEINFKAQEIFK